MSHTHNSTTMNTKNKTHRKQNIQRQRRKSGKKNNPFLTIIAVAVAILIATGVLKPDFLDSFSFGTNVELSSDSGISKSLVDSNPDIIPDYSGEDVIELNDNVPSFTQDDIEAINGEHYSNLDILGRCGVAYAKLDRSMYPEEERGSIGNVKPTGWVQEKYPGVVGSNPAYLYNRCHLIAYAMTGQNDNELNLITGTRYFNADLMLEYEMKVLKYLDSSDNHVLYRVTPFFKDNELLARGVEMEAYSIEDEGRGVSFHVFVYNVQPGVEIDYSTGKSWRAV